MTSPESLRLSTRLRRRGVLEDNSITVKSSRCSHNVNIFHIGIFRNAYVMFFIRFYHPSFALQGKIRCKAILVCLPGSGKYNQLYYSSKLSQLKTCRKMVLCKEKEVKWYWILSEHRSNYGKANSKKNGARHSKKPVDITEKSCQGKM